MTGKAWNQGEKYKPVKGARPLEEVLVEHSTYVSTFHLKERLLKEKIKEYKCECCGRTEWMGKPIALELHHINGIKDDLRIEIYRFFVLIVMLLLIIIGQKILNKDGSMAKWVDAPHLSCGGHLSVRVRIPLELQILRFWNQPLLFLFSYY